MTIQLDPENNETNTLLALAGSFARQRVLEIGCGDGRLTWRYAAGAAHVTAIDPNAEKIALARQSTPPKLRRQVEFQAASLEDFYAAWRFQTRRQRFDRVLLSWSL